MQASNARAPNHGALPPYVHPPLDVPAPLVPDQPTPPPMTPLTNVGYTTPQDNSTPTFAQLDPQDPKTDPAVRMGYTGAAGQQFAAPMKQQAVPYEERSDTVNTYNDVMPGPNQVRASESFLETALKQTFQWLA